MYYKTQLPNSAEIVFTFRLSAKWLVEESRSDTAIKKTYVWCLKRLKKGGEGRVGG